MVLAGKIFKLKEKTDLNYIAAKLKGFKREESFTEDKNQFKLITEIQDLSLRTNLLYGVFSQDKVIYIFHQGDRIPIPKTIEAPFTFTPYKDHVLLTILERKWQANNIANTLSEIIFITSGHITEAKIASETLKKYHEQNPEGTKIIFFDEVDIPNINKLSLYGPSLANTSLYNDYLTHGNIWYIVVTSKKYGHIVGLTRNGVVTIFNEVDPSEFLNYVTEEIFPLIT
jgi:hypothetical protein